MMRHLRKLLLALLLLATLALTALGITAWSLHEPLPTGTSGPEAEALADRMLTAIRADAWARTGAVTWRFPRGHEHLWDRRRNLARVRWSDYEARVNLHTRRAVVTRRDGQPVPTDQAEALGKTAYALWANDSFWLNAPAKIRDPGTTRALVTLPGGERALLVTYGSGGVTPGDSYLWLLDQDGTPRAWRMWVGIIPVGGLEWRWHGWTTTPTGARLAPLHDGIADVNLTDVRAAATLAELVPGPDPFAGM